MILPFLVVPTAPIAFQLLFLVSLLAFQRPCFYCTGLLLGLCKSGARWEASLTSPPVTATSGFRSINPASNARWFLLGALNRTGDATDATSVAGASAGMATRFASSWTREFESVGVRVRLGL